MALTLAILLAGWFQAVLSQDQWRIVDGTGAVQSVWGAAPQLSESQRTEVLSAWVWSELRAPRKVAPDRIGLERFKEDSARLQVRVVRRAAGRPPADLRLIAAPAEMWGDLPEGVLPSWSVPADGRLELPLDPGRPWRLRVAGRSEGSWWVDVRPGHTAALLATSPALGIDLAVLDPDGHPVQAVHASLQEGAARAGTIRTWANAQGNAGRLLAAGLPDEQEIAVTIHHPLAAPLVLRGVPSALPRRVRLSPAAVVTGRLSGIRGAPLAGATVEAETWTSSAVPQVYRVLARSDASGSWEVRGLPPGKIALTLRAPGYVPLLETLEVEAGPQDLGMRTLEVGTSLDIQVVDDEGSPIPGARVTDGQRLSEAEADGRGIARLSGLAVAPLELQGAAQHHLPGKARLNPPFPAPARMVLNRALGLTGRLVDGSGKPVSPGSARIESGTCFSEARLDAGGRFDLDVAPETRGELVLRSPFTQELRVPLAPGTPGEARDLGDLAAAAGLPVTGRVETEGGAPVPGARVWTTRPGPEGPAVAWATRDLLQAVTDMEGRFRLTGLVPAAPAVLRFDAAGFSRAQVELPPKPAEDGGEVDLGTVVLRGGAAVRVRVDPDTVPTEGALARVDIGRRWLDPDLLTAAVVDGEALIPNVPEGSVIVSVLAGRRLLCSQSASVPADGELEVDCRRPPLLVSGQVLSGGVPAGAGVLAWQVPSQAPARIDTIVSPAGLRQQQVAGLGMPQVDVAVGSDGRFQTRDLLPGRWQVSWRAQQGAVTGSVTVEIPAQVEQFETVLPFPGRGIAGRVVDEEGSPAEGARVREMASGAMAFADADGRFSLPGLEPGKLVIQAQLRQQASDLLEIVLQQDREPEPVVLILGDAKPPTLEVRVVDAGKVPVPGAFLFVEEKGKGQRLVVASADGKATVTLEPPLPAQVRVAAFANGAWGLGSWTTLEQALEGLTVQAGGGGTLLLETEKRQGFPSIVTQDGWDLSWLLRQLGAPPFLSAEKPFEMTGLPLGTYSISLGGASLALQVGKGKPAHGRL